MALIKRIHRHAAPESPAAAYLAAGLKIAGVDVNSGSIRSSRIWLGRFESNAMYSKPLSFYTWSAELTQVFRFMRFFQQPLPPNQPTLDRGSGQGRRLRPEAARGLQASECLLRPAHQSARQPALWPTCSRAGKARRSPADRRVPDLSIQGNGAVWPLVSRGTSARCRLDEGDDPGHSPRTRSTWLPAPAAAGMSIRSTHWRHFCCRKRGQRTRNSCSQRPTRSGCSRLFRH